MKILTPRKRAKGGVRRVRAAAEPLPVRIVIEGELEIPPIRNLAEFREWACSDEFPERGRIDYIDGSIEILDMAPEALGSHGSPKMEIVSVIHHRLKSRRSGKVFVDRTRLSCPKTGLSVEPDVLFVSHEAIESGRARFVPLRSHPYEYIEVEGEADLVVEIVSHSSVTKDRVRLPEQYFASGVREFWLVDGRGADLEFDIFRRGRTGFVRTKKDADGFVRSKVLAGSFRLDRSRDVLGPWEYELLEAD
jgi:Uma2 family endonuclease